MGGRAFPTRNKHCNNEVTYGLPCPGLLATYGVHFRGASGYLLQLREALANAKVGNTSWLLLQWRTGPAPTYLPT
jgi:hypothetical protein